MNKSMLHTVLLSAIAALLLVSCSNSNDPSANRISRGVITGPDYRKCSNICCGGWFIEIEGKEYRFLELPPGSNVPLLENNYPIPVKLAWSPASEGADCYSPVIVVHSIAGE